MRGPYDARFYDGRSAAALGAQVEFGPDGIDIEVGGARRLWRYRHIDAELAASQARITNRREADAILVLEGAAAAAFAEAAPDIASGARGRRRLARGVIAMVGAAASIATLVFIGAPAASGPLADATPRDIEARIGANLAAQVKVIAKPCGAAEGLALFDPALAALVEAVDPGFGITFTVLNTEVPNAIALPGGQVMATRGLLDAVGEDQEAFYAVIAHELGHVKNRDSLKAAYRNYGGAILLEAITGGSGVAQQLVIVASQLNQMRHSRQQEAQADAEAFDALERAGLDPSALARAFEAIVRALPEEDAREIDPAKDNRSRARIADWMSSHPRTQDRIDRARARARDSARTLLSAEDWTAFRMACDAPAQPADAD